MQFPYIIVVGAVIGGIIGTVGTMRLTLPPAPLEHPAPSLPAPPQSPLLFTDPPGVTPQMRIDQTFNCLRLHHYGVSCPGDTSAP